MRSHGIAPNAATIKPAPTSMSRSLSASLKPDPSSASKKRKTIDGFTNGEDADDEEVFGTGRVKEESSAKEIKRDSSGVVKEENGGVSVSGLLGLGLPQGQRMNENGGAGIGLGLGVDLGDVNKELMNYYTSNETPLYEDESELGAGDHGGYDMSGRGGSDYTLSGRETGYSNSGKAEMGYGNSMQMAENQVGGGFGMRSSPSFGYPDYGVSPSFAGGQMAGMSSTIGLGVQYQSSAQAYENQGRPDSPLIVE